MDALRGFMVSGVEAASCLLLQDHFSWRHDSVGLVIGLTFCLVVPGYMLLRQHLRICIDRITTLVKSLGIRLHKRYAEWFGDVAWIRIYTCLAMLATVMLGEKPRCSKFSAIARAEGTRTNAFAGAHVFYLCSFPKAHLGLSSRVVV